MDLRPVIAMAIAAAILVGAMVAVRAVSSRYLGRELSARGTFFLTMLALFALWLLCFVVAMLLDAIR